MADQQNQLWIKRGDDGAYEVAPYRFDGSASFVTMDSCLDLQQELANISTESMKRELTLARLVGEVLAIRDRVQFLEKALEQAVSRIVRGRQSAMNGLVLNIAGDEDELAQYLKEKKEE